MSKFPPAIRVSCVYLGMRLHDWNIGIMISDRACRYIKALYDVAIFANRGGGGMSKYYTPISHQMIKVIKREDRELLHLIPMLEQMSDEQIRVFIHSLRI